MKETIDTALELLSKIFTIDNITLALATFGSAGTAWNIIQNKKRIELIHEKTFFNKESGTLAVELQFINKSRLPIAITDVCFLLDKKPISCEKEPRIAFSNAHQRFGEVLIKDFYTQSFPLQLGSLGGTSTVLVFELPPKTDIDFSTEKTFQVSSNRGRAVEKKLRLDLKSD